jgi:hypothetical protein
MTAPIEKMHWRPASKAALCAAIIVIPASIILYLLGLEAAREIPPQSHSAISVIAFDASFWALMPGIILEIVRAMIYSPQGGHGVNENSWLIPIGSFGFYFLVFLPIFRLIAPRSARRQSS